MTRASKLLGSLLCLGLLILGAPLRPTVSAQAPSDGTDAGVERVEEVLRDLQENDRSEEPMSKTYTLGESDLNAYLESQLRKHQHKGVEVLEVRLQQDRRLRTILDMNMDEIQLGQDLAILILLNMVGNRPKVEMEGELTVEDGLGTYQVKSMLLSGNEVPAYLIETVLTSIGRSQEPPFDPSQPFEMPYRIKSVKIELGRVTIQT